LQLASVQRALSRRKLSDFFAAFCRRFVGQDISPLKAWPHHNVPHVSIRRYVRVTITIAMLPRIIFDRARFDKIVERCLYR
jgi:hypothetical protein